MKRKLSNYSIPVSTLLLALLLLAATPAQAQNNTSNDSNIAGTWSILWTSQQVPPFMVTIQFSSDGNVIATETDAFAISQGVWLRVDGQSYALTVYQYAFGALGQPYRGTFKTNLKLKLSPNGEKLAGKYHLDFYDTKGVPQFSDDGTVAGSRVHVQKMP
jgi:hypothetical protein